MINHATVWQQKPLSFSGPCTRVWTANLTNHSAHTNLEIYCNNGTYLMPGLLIDMFLHLNTCKSASNYTGIQGRIIQFSNCPFAVPSQAPRNLSLTAKNSTSIEASWQLPPAEDSNGIITGFKLFYKKKGSSGSPTQITINSGSILTKVVTELDEYTEYEFQVLAYTSVGDGPKSSAKSKRTMEDGEETQLYIFIHKFSIFFCLEV